MKTPFFWMIGLAGLAVWAGPAWGANPPAGNLTVAQYAKNSDVRRDLPLIIEKINTKVGQGKSSEADYAEQIKELDALYQAHKTEKSNDVAQIIYTKGQLYMAVLRDPKKAVASFQQLQKEFPNFPLNQTLTATIAALQKQAAAPAAPMAAAGKGDFAVGSKFPDFAAKDLDGRPLSVAAFKGKVVLVDFWATWCGPCMAEMPNVISTYQKNHLKGFEIIGVSLDSDKAALLKGLKDNKMTWPQYFDGKQWKNELGVKYHIDSIPASFLIDRNGVIVAKDLRGPELAKAVAAALAKP